MYRPSQALFLTAYGGVGGDEHLIGSRLLGRSNNVGASATWLASERLGMSVWYSKYNYDAHDRPETDQFHFRTDYALASGRTVALEVRHFTRDWDIADDTAYALVYEIPLNIPVGRRQDVGAINGTLTCLDGAGPAGIARAILSTTDATAVTDSSGSFTFPSLAPGTYLVRISPRSIGYNRVPEAKTPMRVEVKPGQTTRLDISVVEAASISGRVILSPANGEQNGPGSAEPSVIGDPRRGRSNTSDRAPTSETPVGLANILVELRSADEVVRRVTDSRGPSLSRACAPGTGG